MFQSSEIRKPGIRDHGNQDRAGFPEDLDWGVAGLLEWRQETEALDADTAMHGGRTDAADEHGPK